MLIEKFLRVYNIRGYVIGTEIISIFFSTKFEYSCCGHLCNMSTAILDENGWSERWTYRLPQNFQYYVSMQIHVFIFNINFGVSMLNKYLFIWLKYIVITYKTTYFDFISYIPKSLSLSYWNIKMFLFSYSIWDVSKYYDCIPGYAISITRWV